MVMSSPSQVLRQAEALKATIADSPKSIFELWVTRQRLEDLYKKLLLMDLEYALDKKVEQDLWNHAFKNQINVLQSQAKDKQNPKRGEVQASLNLFLETASGFFTQLSQLICSTFRLDLPFRRKASSLGIIKEKSPLKSKVAPPKKSSCLYMVQYCLVHLGDIARYRQQVDQAETYYRHAANLIPQNGHPYNQLAILEAARGSKLSTVFYYMRSLAVRSPFPVAATNLEKFYAKLIKDITDSRSKLSMSEVVNTFLQFNALLHLSSELPKAAILRDRLMASLPPHITSQSFQAVVLVHFAAISLFTLHHIRDGSSTSPQLRDSPAPRNGGRPMDRSQEEEKAFQLALSFLVSFLDALLQYTPKQGQKAREFFTLPAVRVVLDWLSIHRDTLHNTLLSSSSVWGQLCKVLNCILPSAEETANLDLAKYEEMPLMEDQELRCFQPIEKAHQALSFSRVPSDGLSVQVEALLRCKRLVAHGEWIAQDFPHLVVLTCQTKNGRPFFSTPPQTSNANETGGERKTTRQNVAIQAIIQKQSSARKTEAPVTGTKQQGAGDAEPRSAGTVAMGQSGSPKYVLGVPTTEPQFMKHSSSGRQGGGQGGGQYPRYPSPSPLSQSSSQTSSSTPTSGSQPSQRSSNPPPPPHSSRNQGTFTPNLPPRLSPAAQNQNQNQGHGHVGASASQGSSIQATHSTPAPPRQAWAQHGPGVRETGSQEWGALVPGDRDRHHPPPGTAAKGSPSSPSAVSGGSQPTSPLGPGPRGGLIRPPQPPTPKVPSNQEELMSALRLASQLSNPNSPLCTKASGAQLPVSMAQPGLSSQGPTPKVGPLGQGGPGLGFNPMGLGPGLMGPRGTHLGPGMGQMPGATGQMGPGSGPPLSGMLGSGMSQLGPGMNPLNASLGPMGPGVVRPGMGQVATASGPRMGFPQAPGTERCQNSPKMLQQQQQQQPSTHTPGAPPPSHPHPQPPTSVFQSQQSHPTAFTKFPSHHPLSYAPPGAQRVAGNPFHPSLYGGDENGGGVSSSYISSISQLTIQPPKPAEMRHNSTFQGHAEGTPKPDSIFPESGELELEKSGEGTPSQPGTYSLFSGSSWSAPLSTSNDSKSHGSSPFSSAGSSIRNSPEHPLEGPHLGGAGAGRGRMPSGGHSGGAPSPLEGLRYDRHSHWGVMSPSPLNEPPSQPPPASHPQSQAQPQPPNPQQSASFLASSIQSIWASSQTLSPLERLLEQQRHRQNEPH